MHVLQNMVGLGTFLYHNCEVLSGGLLFVCPTLLLQDLHSECCCSGTSHKQNKIGRKAATTLHEAESRAVSPAATSFPPTAVLGSRTR